MQGLRYTWRLSVALHAPHEHEHTIPSREGVTHDTEVSKEAFLKPFESCVSTVGFGRCLVAHRVQCKFGKCQSTAAEQ